MDIEEQEALANRLARNCLYVETKKGANFRGCVRSVYYNPHMKHWGVVVVSDSPEFAGTTHVYPVTQLKLI